MKKTNQEKTQNIVVFRPHGSQITVEVHFKRETVWLTQAQIAVLFGTKRPAITKHLLNIFKNKELNQKSVCSILEHTATDGKVYKTQNVNNENWNISKSVIFTVNPALPEMFRENHSVRITQFFNRNSSVFKEINK